MSSSTPVGTSVQGGGTVPGEVDDTEKLDAVVVKAANFRGKGISGWIPRELPANAIPHPSQDWNALIAARWKLREDGWQFDFDGQDECWRVRNVSHRDYPTFEFCWLEDHGIEAEALALARCIAAVGESDD